MNAKRMRPLQALPEAALRPLRGVLTDIDDTLTRDGAIEPMALQALQQMAQAQLPVIAITGRPAGWSEPFAMAWPVAAIVAENGAVMLRRVGGRLQRDFTQDDATRAANLLRLQHCADAVLAAVPRARLARDSAGRLTDIAVDHSEFAQLGACRHRCGAGGDASPRSARQRQLDPCQRLDRRARQMDRCALGGGACARPALRPGASGCTSETPPTTS